MVKLITLTLLVVVGLLYLRKQHIKRKERDCIDDIPIFLRGGEYALHNGPGTKIIDPIHIYPITPKVKKLD